MRRCVRVLKQINWQSKIWQRRLSLWLVSWTLLLAVIQRSVEQKGIVPIPRICTKEKNFAGRQCQCTSASLVHATSLRMSFFLCLCLPCQTVFTENRNISKEIQRCLFSQMTNQYVLGVYFFTSVTKIGGVTSWNSNLLIS